MPRTIHFTQEFPSDIPPRSRRFLNVLLLFPLVLLLGCSGGGNSNNNGNGPSFDLTISPNLPVIAIGNTEQFSAATVDPGTGNPIVVSGITINWSSSSTGVATIDSKTGLATTVGAGSTTITANATNSLGNGVAMQIMTLKVVNPLSMNAGPLPLGALTMPYPTTGLASGGAAPITWSLLNGTTPPAGLTFNSNGTLTGTPTATGVSANFTVQATDSETPPVTKQATFSVTVLDPANPCSIMSNADPGELSGSYAILLQGLQATTANGTPVAMAGSFAADGSGSITGGEVDLNVAAGPQHLTINGGVYAVTATGQGCLQLKYSGGGSNAFHFALSQVLNASNIATHGRIIEFDGYQGMAGGAATNLASGVLLLQDNSEFSASSLASRFAFGMDGFDTAGKHVALGGTFNFNNANSNLTSFAQDSDDGGTISTVTGATGAATSTATTGTTGRETVAVTFPGPTTVHLASYIVNANEIFLISTGTFSAASPIFSGRAVVTGSSYTENSLSGNYIYRAEGVDYEGDGAACAANAPCALTDIAVLNANAGSGALTGTLFQSQAGVTQMTSITSTTYSVDPSVGRVQLTSANGGKPPVYYLAAPVTSGTDATEPIEAFVIGSGPTMNSNTGDPTAQFGFIEAQPNGPFTLNSPPAYILATEDPGTMNSANCVIGIGNFTAAAITLNRDLSGPGGLIFNGPTSFSFTLNLDGTMAGAAATPNIVGVTNSTAASPGKALAIPNASSAAIRVFDH